MDNLLFQKKLTLTYATHYFMIILSLNLIPFIKGENKENMKTISQTQFNEGRNWWHGRAEESKSFMNNSIIMFHNKLKRHIKISKTQQLPVDKIRKKYTFSFLTFNVLKLAQRYTSPAFQHSNPCGKNFFKEFLLSFFHVEFFLRKGGSF